MRGTTKLIVGVLAASALLLAGLTYYGYTERQAADRRGARLTVRTDSLAAELAGARAELRLDSLIFAGDLPAARRRLAGRSAADSAGYAQRLRYLDRLQALEYTVDTLRRRAPRTDTVLLTKEVVALPPPAPLPAANDLTVDSLRATLARAQRRIRSLENRPPPPEPEFLVFRTGEGNDVYYVGELRGGKAYGQGAAILSTGSRYRGGWRNNQKHGQGTFNWTDGAYYEGQYENDHRSGEGTYHFPDGSRYVGQWQNDLRHGQGTYYNKKGKAAARGKWEEDRFVGN